MFHSSYFAYYLIIITGPLILLVHRRRREAQGVVFSMMVAFVLCYVVFISFPVGGPYYAFDQPTGPVRDVWSAHLVYGVLAAGSSFGAAFPSSHVAATVATTASVGIHAPILGALFIVPAGLLTAGTVYCQTHYGVDAAGGLLVGGLATWIGVTVIGGRDATRVTRWQSPGDCHLVLGD